MTGWPAALVLSHFTMIDMDAGYLATLLARRARTVSSVTRMSSQRYTPRYPAIRGKAPRKATPGNDLPQGGVQPARDRLPGAKIGANRRTSRTRIRFTTTVIMDSPA